ncbi:MAG: hypothetical protein ABSB56_04890 [Nitrososphaerales archaeon]
MTSPEGRHGVGISKRVGLGIVVAVLIIAGVVALVATSRPSATTTTTMSTYISAGADSILASAVQTNPSGFVLVSSKPAASGSSDWASLQSADGSEANVTVLVYPSTNASRAYFDRFVTGVSGLTGYTDITSDLASFQQYGKCYGYGEDVEGIAVANGVCTKGNAFLQVHLASSISFSALEGDLTSIMGALYQSAT